MIPRTLYQTELQLLTPCFCAGSDQTAAELRAPSFRGELRWWFRCLGGTPQQERALFGAAHPTPAASALALLVTDIKKKPPFNWVFEAPTQSVTNSAYITWFLDKRSADYLPPGQRFTLELRQTREIPHETPEELRKMNNLLTLAWDCLCNLGAVGARKTRGLGAYAPVRPDERRLDELTKHPIVSDQFDLKLCPRNNYGNPELPQTTTALLTDCALKLREYRNHYNIHASPKQKKAGKFDGFSVLGYAESAPGVQKRRQMSLVRFRPYLTAAGELRLCILKAPLRTACPAAQARDIRI